MDNGSAALLRISSWALEGNLDDLLEPYSGSEVTTPSGCLFNHQYSASSGLADATAFSLLISNPHSPQQLNDCMAGGMAAHRPPPVCEPASKAHAGLPAMQSPGLLAGLSATQLQHSVYPQDSGRWAIPPGGINAAAPLQSVPSPVLSLESATHQHTAAAGPAADSTSSQMLQTALEEHGCAPVTRMPSVEELSRKHLRKQEQNRQNQLACRQRKKVCTEFVT